MKKTCLIGGLGLALAACSVQQPLKSTKWSKSSLTPAPEVVNSNEFKTKEVSLQIGSRTIMRAQQMWNGAEVEGAFLQEIRDSKGSLLYINTQYTEQKFSELNDSIKKAQMNKYVFLNELKKSIPELSHAEKILQPKLIINTEGVSPSLHWVIDYFNTNGTNPQQLRVALNGNILNKETVGSRLAEGRATIYPVGPKLSSLSEVLLTTLIGDGTLSSPRFKVLNWKSEQAVSPELKYDFDPNDGRFNQVQAFYYMEKYFRHMNDVHGFGMPFAVDVKVNVTDDTGAQTNMAIYYKKTIRLGSGDGVLYSRIPQDPSIVMHETSHSVVDAIAGLPFDSEGGSMNEGFADFFATSQLDNSKLAETSYTKGPFKRNVDNQSKFSEKNGGLYHDSLILSGTFWELRNQFGADLTENLALQTLAHLGPQSKFVDFAPAVIEASKAIFSSDQQKYTETILRKREWPF